MEKPTPRVARDTEANEFVQIFRECRREIPLTSDLDDPRWTTWAANHCRARHFWVLELDGSIAAAMLLEGNEISYVVVKEAARGRSLGPQLVAYAQTLQPSLLAKADEGNQRAQNMLERAGFRVEAATPKEAAKVPGACWRRYIWKRRTR